jgi:fumarate reductase flavoprotein subunit
MKKLEADIIVVAAGAAGLAASIAAAESGAKVIAFEKASTTGGTGSMGMGLLGVESRLQRLKKLGPTRDEAFKIFMDYTHWQVDARLA